MCPTLDWGKLYSQGRCKAPGIPFDEEEDHALYKLKIPVDYVRDGILTLEDYQKALAKEADSGKKPLARMDREQLVDIAKKLGIKISPEVNKEILVSEIRKRQNLKEQKAEAVKNVKKAYEAEEKFQAKQSARAKSEKDKAFEEAKNAGLGTNPQLADAEAGEKGKAEAKKKAEDAKAKDEKKAKEEKEAKEKAEKEVEEEKKAKAKADEKSESKTKEGGKK